MCSSSHSKKSWSSGQQRGGFPVQGPIPQHSDTCPGPVWCRHTVLPAPSRETEGATPSPLGTSPKPLCALRTCFPPAQGTEFPLGGTRLVSAPGEPCFVFWIPAILLVPRLEAVSEGTESPTGVHVILTLSQILKLTASPLPGPHHVCQTC